MSVAAMAATPLDRLDEVLAALRHVERGAKLSAAQRGNLAGHLLWPYLEYTELARRLDRADTAEVRAFLTRHADLAIANTLRVRWLHILARRGHWSDFLRDWREQTEIDLRCHFTAARWRTGAVNAELNAESIALWLHGESLPAACDPVFSALQHAGLMNDSLRWRRIALAAQAGHSRLMRFLSRGLPKTERARAGAFADFVAAPSRRAMSWPRDARNGAFAAAGLIGMAARDVDAAEVLLAALAAPLGMTVEERGRAQNAIALWSAASYLPGSARRLAVVPAAAYDARLHEWRVREALARADWLQAELAIAKMAPAQKQEPRYRYFHARLNELRGDPAGARTFFAALAREAHYYGFLAADRLDAGYALCPLELHPDATRELSVAADPGLRRALDLHAIGRSTWALEEWQRMQARFDPDSRREAVRLAIAAGWTDRAVFDLAGADDLRFYRLRFPLAQRRHLEVEAKRHRLDPAWVAALIRAESAWQPKARSHANALGLMQLLPSVGAATARQLRIAWRGPESLYQPTTNISLGTAHLAAMMARHDDSPLLATAAYNAGPSPVARWRRERPSERVDLWPVDIWVETIPYRETRDYVARIMAFSVVYDWRLGRKPLAVTDRLAGRLVGAGSRHDFACQSGFNPDAAKPRIP